MPAARKGDGKPATFGCAYEGCGQVSLPYSSPPAPPSLTDPQTYSRMEYLKRHQRKREPRWPNRDKKRSRKT